MGRRNNSHGWRFGVTTVVAVVVSLALYIWRVQEPEPTPESTERTQAPASKSARFVPTRQPVGTQGGRASSRTAEQMPASPPALSPAVLAITGEQHQTADYNVYRDALRALTRNLSDADVAALKQFLKRRAADQSIMRPIAFNGIKNDVLDILLMQNQVPDGIGPLLVKMYHDKTYDDMWRDYCVQFITAYYETKWLGSIQNGKESKRSRRRKEKERTMLLAAYKDALKETDGTIAGTALIGLDSLSARDERIDPGDVTDAALDILADPSIGEPARISAFAVAASRELTDALPEARIMAQTGETVPLRMAAIALIGKLGSSEDLELLSALAWDAEPRLKRLLESALESLRKRRASSSALKRQPPTLHSPDPLPLESRIPTSVSRYSISCLSRKV